MKRYAAFLRGVTPMNLKMADLQRSLEVAGFTGVKTVLSSGNVVFDARPASEASLEHRVEAAMSKHLGRSFFTIVRPVEALAALLEADPYSRFRLKPGSKRIVTFLRGAAKAGPTIPVERDGARILCRRGGEIYSAYVSTPRGPVFMSLIEATFGREVTTRTWDTVAKVAKS